MTPAWNLNNQTK